MAHFSSSWKSSRKPGKQRKYRLNAPLHIKSSLASAHLSKELRKIYGKRSATVRKGDKVRVLRGQFKKQEGKVERVDLKNIKVFVAGIEFTRRDGTKKQLALHPSSMMIIELNTDDKLRQKSFERK